MRWDDKESSSSTEERSVEKLEHMKYHVDAINNCGVFFNMGEEKCR